MNFDIYSGILAVLDSNRNSSEDHYEFKYTISNEVSAELLDRYNLEKVAGEDTDISKIINIMNWLYNNTYHDGQYDNHIGFNVINLLQYSFSNGMDKGLNCSSLSTILTSCYLSLGYKAKTVFLMPLSPYDCDNHSVTTVFIPQINKWVLMDPTYNLFFHDDDSTMLSISELRNILSKQESVQINNNAGYNGSEAKKSEILEYYAKNLAYYYTYENGINTIDDYFGNRLIVVAPEGVNVQRVKLANIDYRINLWGENEDMRKWKSLVFEEEYVYISKSAFEE